MSMMLAEELDVDYRSIALEAALTTPEYYSPLFREYLTAGSVTTGSTSVPMRTAGAKARAMLLEAASQDWQVPTAELITEDGNVTHVASGRNSTYGELLEVIHRLDIQLPETVALKDPSEFKVLGKPGSGAMKALARSMVQRSSGSISNCSGWFMARLQAASLFTVWSVSRL